LWAAPVSFGLITIVELYVLVRAAIASLAGVPHWQHDAHQDHAAPRRRESCSRKHLPTAAEIDAAGAATAP